MKLSEFILLNEEDKKMAVLQEGVLVAKRSNTDYMVFSFPVEKLLCRNLLQPGKQVH